MRLATFRIGGRVGIGTLDGDGLRVLEAQSMLEWLRGDGRGATGEELSVAEVDLLAPVPNPPGVRDFYAFEGHVAAGWAKRGAEVPGAWYEAPAFYFSNPASIHGPDEPVHKPVATEELDFELEIAAVIGSESEIAGFTLMNDWSARDVQRTEMTVGLGPAKGKDFATSLGPWLVTPDELRYEDGRLQVEATASVNETELTRSDAGEQHFSWPALVAHAARETHLRPGDVIGSGTLNRGCLLELGPLEGGRYLEPGDTVVLRADGLGALRSTIA